MSISLKDNFFKRVATVIIFVPIIVTSILFGGYLLFLTFILLLCFAIDELFTMLKGSKNIWIYYLYIIISVFAFYSFILLISNYPNLSYLFIEIIFIIWIFDTFCYLGGTILKGKKLMPNISPGKTINGLITGIAITNLVILFYSYFNSNDLYLSFLISNIVILLSFIGDVFASLLKRDAGIKDSGNLLPGHGGIVDRMDSFIFVFFVVGIYFSLL